ncbi:AAA family ATPase [Streptomyces parvulus]|uniref:AAA family ATPase n=1 Tax=Streptomyces parvulus TaxID=146923 RepID=UPI003441A689
MGHLLERGAALTLLASEIRRTSAGLGRLVLLRGASGMGRSTLLDAAVTQAKDSGFDILSVRCSTEGMSAPLSTVARLMNPAVRTADSVPPPSEESRGVRFWQILEDKAAHAPVLLAVDDVQLADPASRAWLAETVRRIDSSPVLLVATERSQYDIPAPSMCLNRTLPASVAISHTLDPLSASASAEFVRAAAPSASPEWIAECVRAGAGNPLLLHALMEDVGNDHASPLPELSAALYPGAYPGAVDWWLNGAGAVTRQVARALAVAEQDGLRKPVKELSRFIATACGTDPARTLGWLTAMKRLGVLHETEPGSLAYAHPLLRDAVLGDWPTEHRDAISRSFAETMLSDGDHAEAIARQLLRSGPGGRGWALRALEDAASTATSGERPEAAIRYLRRALAESDAATPRYRLLHQLGTMEYRHGNGSTGVQQLHDALLIAAGPRQKARTAIALGTALTERGDFQDAIGLLRATKQDLSGDPAATWSIEAAALLLAERNQGVRSPGQRQPLAGTARSSLASVPAGRALLVRHDVLAGEIAAQRAMALVRSSLSEPADDLSEPFLLSSAASVALWADETQEAEGLAERGLGEPSWTRLHPVGHSLHAVRAEITLIRGDYKALLTEHAAAFGARRTGHPALPSYALLALTELGSFDEARSLMQEPDSSRAGDMWEPARFLYAGGVLRAAQGDFTGALHDFLDCGRRLTAHSIVSPSFLPWRSAAALCRLARGDRSAALALAREELKLARAWNTPRSVGRALHAVAVATGGNEGLALGAEAVRLLRKSPDARDLIAALLSHGRQLASAGRRTDARTHYHEAARRAEQLGSVRLRVDAERDLRTVGVRRPSALLTGSESLTGSERRVSELAAEGRTNTEISNLLQITRRTVESHLTRSYRKLGIQGRDTLRTALRSVEDGT